jgi:hypothetical protein
MTTSALIVMLSAWTLITYYTVKFFLKVLKNPTSQSEEADE